MFHHVANRTGGLIMKSLFGCMARIHVLRREHVNRCGGFLLVSNHISHFDPPIIAAVVERKIDWMAMDELFQRWVGPILRAVDAFPVNRHHAAPRQIRIAIERLQRGRIVGLFPEGGIRDGTRSVLEGGKLRRGAITLAHLTNSPIVPCVIVGSDSFYGLENWQPFAQPAVWIAFGDPIRITANGKRSDVREAGRQALIKSLRNLYTELRETFSLTADDLPKPPEMRMKKRPKSGASAY
jgi:1-acyl-sn-glycerol-3-phosphate acyltransferase